MFNKSLITYWYKEWCLFPLQDWSLTYYSLAQWEPTMHLPQMTAVKRTWGSSLIASYWILPSLGHGFALSSLGTLWHSVPLGSAASVSRWSSAGAIAIKPFTTAYLLKWSSRWRKMRRVIEKANRCRGKVRLPWVHQRGITHLTSQLSTRSLTYQPLFFLEGPCQETKGMSPLYKKVHPSGIMVLSQEDLQFSSAPKVHFTCKDNLFLCPCILFRSLEIPLSNTLRLVLCLRLFCHSRWICNIRQLPGV